MEQVSICTRICFALREFFCVAKVEIFATYDPLDEVCLVVRPPSVQNCAGSQVTTYRIIYEQQ